MGECEQTRQKVGSFPNWWVGGGGICEHVIITWAGHDCTKQTEKQTVIEGKDKRENEK
jgi:hypothetical protein